MNRYELAHKLADCATNTCRTIEQILLAADMEDELSDEEVLDLLLDANVDMCPGCGWWFECCELDEDTSLCDQCRDEDEDEADW